MLRRLWHILVTGHPWRIESVTFCPPSEMVGWYEMDERKIQMRYGFTEVSLTCSCGQGGRKRLTGQHEIGTGDATQGELAELRKMAGL